MPVKTAMNIAMGTESTPRRRICATTSGAHVRTSARARKQSIAAVPTRPIAPPKPVPRMAKRCCTT